jgi:Putative prokaryotic signal transducing protein
MVNRNEWVVVYSGTIVEADLLRCLLDGEGIESMLQNEALGMIAPYVFPAGAGVCVLIQRGDLDKARPIVEDYARNKSRRLHEA